MTLLRHRAILSALGLSLIVACSDNQTTQLDLPAPDTMTLQEDAENIQVSKQALAEPKAEALVKGGAEPPTGRNVNTVRSADRHTHGNAELFIVLEEGVATIEFESPLYNILGFEHNPETKAQKEVVRLVEEQLARGNQLFTFNDEASCDTKSQPQSLKLFHGYSHDEGEGLQNHDHDHESHDSSPVDGEHLAHKDVLLRYEFVCGKPSALSNVRINLFEFFEELSEVDVTYLGPSTQQQLTLTRYKSEMDITQ